VLAFTGAKSVWNLVLLLVRGSISESIGIPPYEFGDGLATNSDSLL
jgi:hypothetical protein